MKLLGLDTSSGQCSVALLADGQVVTRSATTAREHAQLLLPMIDAVLAEAGLALAALDGIAFGRGPGSFTGVRIAAAATQGLAAGAGLPVLAVSDLRALAEGARRRLLPAAGAAAAGSLLACMDARMGEIYWGLFAGGAESVAGPASSGERLSAPQVLVDEVSGLLATSGVLAGAAGMALSAYPTLVEQLHLDTQRCFTQAEPHAEDIVRLAAFDLRHGANWLDAAAAQPVYLRDKVVQAPL